MKRVISDETVQQEFAAGRRRLSVSAARDVITPAAWSKARELGVTIELSEDTSKIAAKTPTKTPTKTKMKTLSQGSAERIVDPSGLLVVRGHSVKLGSFPAAGPERNIGLVDLVTAKDGSPMTAGIMSWGREDSFPWSLDYDEIDLVLEGVLHIEIDGRKLEGRAGDVFYIPKGSQIVFGTPSRTRVFYVTYPANWTEASSAPARPQK